MSDQAAKSRYKAMEEDDWETADFSNPSVDDRKPHQTKPSPHPHPNHVVSQPTNTLISSSSSSSASSPSASFTIMTNRLQPTANEFQPRRSLREAPTPSATGGQGSRLEYRSTSESGYENWNGDKNGSGSGSGNRNGLPSGVGYLGGPFWPGHGTNSSQGQAYLQGQGQGQTQSQQPYRQHGGSNQNYPIGQNNVQGKVYHSPQGYPQGEGQWQEQGQRRGYGQGYGRGYVPGYGIGMDTGQFMNTLGQSNQSLDDEWFRGPPQASNRQLWDTANRAGPTINMITSNMSPSVPPAPKMQILRRPGGGATSSSSSSSRSVSGPGASRDQATQGPKTYTQREEEYRLARERIFGPSSSSSSSSESPSASMGPGSIMASSSIMSGSGTESHNTPTESSEGAPYSESMSRPKASSEKGKSRYSSTGGGSGIVSRSASPENLYARSGGVKSGGDISGGGVNLDTLQDSLKKLEVCTQGRTEAQEIRGSGSSRVIGTPSTPGTPATPETRGRGPGIGRVLRQPRGPGEGVGFTGALGSDGSTGAVEGSLKGS